MVFFLFDGPSHWVSPLFLLSPHEARSRAGFLPRTLESRSELQEIPFLRKRSLLLFDFCLRGLSPQQPSLSSSEKVLLELALFFPKVSHGHPSPPS